MTTVEAFIADLCRRHPEDAEDLQDALADLHKQKLSTCDRLRRLTDSQWQRLGLPLGVESLIRDELEAASPGAVPAAAVPDAAPGRQARPQRPPPPQHSFDDDGEVPLEPFEYQGLARRRVGDSGRSREQVGTGRSSASSPSKPKQRGLLNESELKAPPDLEQLWEQLLEDTLPPDKRGALQETWLQTPQEHDRYMMFLEYSSYLRKPEISEEEKEERKKQLEPMMRELGVDIHDQEEPGGAFVWWLLFGVMLFVGSLVYYVYAEPDIPHDPQGL
eukprot:TRINITY_DN11689_c0_g2_i1.p1 TRINITY_DN11689_c0_g2~~TRINITY_DN11689_c0_g2_i1.p1  ORF type:complete len:275 (+),score=68.42 TRINITY_DN11689_c0_g2_i1:116-940(+)